MIKYLLHGITIKSEKGLPEDCRNNLSRVVQALPINIRSSIDAIRVDTLHDWCFILKYFGDYERLQEPVSKIVNREVSPAIVDCWFGSATGT